MNEQAASTTASVAADARRRFLNRAWDAARHRHVAGIAALGGVLAIAALSYWWTEAPLYNAPGTIDPWLYTALFVNFDQIYENFGTTYYASRLPWIVPGRILYEALPLDIAYWILHGLAFAGGVTALFFLVRRYLGIAPAVVGAATLALSPMYWNAHYWDYIDGVMMTYLLGGLCLGLPLARGSRRAASLAGAGVFFAAAVTTNLLAAVFALIYPVMYVFVQPASGLRQRVALALKDVAALLVGASVLVVALGFYARANGGSFFFFEPQIDVVRSGIVGSSKIPGYDWLRGEARLLVPVFLVLVGIPILALARRVPPFRFAAGCIAGLAFLTGVAYAWEFVGGGAILDYTYSASNFAIPIALAMASIAALVVSPARSRLAHLGLAAVATGAGVTALGLIYSGDRSDWTGPTGARIALVVMVLAALLVLVTLASRGTGIGVIAALLAVGAVSFASHFAVNSSTGIFIWSAAAPDNRSVYHAAVESTEFVKRSTGGNASVPRFWYSGVKRPDFISIQSMYYFGYTLLATRLPTVDAEMRRKLDVWKPRTVVMLCETRDCGGAAAALRRAGYPYAEDGAKHISRGGSGLWVVLLRCKGTPHTPVRDGALLRAPPASEIYAYWRGRKHWIASLDVLFDVFGLNALSSVRDVAPHFLERMPSGRRVTSPRVWEEISGGHKAVPPPFC
jgi:hypothetical protein